MSYIEAVEDGIRHTDDPNGLNWYYPICHVCNMNEVPTWMYRRGVKYTCDICKLKENLEDKKSKVTEDWDTKEKKYANAVKRMQAVCSHWDAYSNACEKIHKKLHTNGWFQSTEEIMVAIELVQKNVKARHQVQFGRYRVDFVLPDEKILLEVDGKMYHNESTKKKEIIRDNLILINLGPSWEMIRIGDDMINENISRLVGAVRKLKEKRKVIRSMHGGIIPDWYNDRKT